MSHTSPGLFWIPGFGSAAPLGQVSEVYLARKTYIRHKTAAAVLQNPTNWRRFTPPQSVSPCLDTVCQVRLPVKTRIPIIPRQTYFAMLSAAWQVSTAASRSQGTRVRFPAWGGGGHCLCGVCTFSPPPCPCVGVLLRVLRSPPHTVPKTLLVRVLNSPSVLTPNRCRNVATRGIFHSNFIAVLMEAYS